MRVLVTGAAGFAGRRLIARLERDADVELFALARRVPDESAGGARTTWLAVDLDDRRATLAAVREVAPERVVHLAALADPRRCRCPG
jgi:nucleoside-diphosphate-sugar epimerase